MDMKPNYEPGQIDKEAPDKIWLQIDADQIHENREQPWPSDDDGITWCRESVQGLEIEYIRADLVADLLKDAERYRWLRKNSSQVIFHTDDGMYCFSSDDLRECTDGQECLDSSIDIAISHGMNG